MITTSNPDAVVDVRDAVIGRLTVQLEQERELTGKLIKELVDLRDALGVLARQGDAYRHIGGFR